MKLKQKTSNDNDVLSTPLTNFNTQRVKIKPPRRKKLKKKIGHTHVTFLEKNNINTQESEKQSIPRKLSMKTKHRKTHILFLMV